MDKTSIVILHYQGESDTFECLNSLRINHADNRRFNTIVVINPNQKSKKSKISSFIFRLKREYPHVLVMENSENTGFARGNNIGIRKALDLDSEYILLLNNDTVVSLELVSKLVSFAKSDPRIGLISPKIYFAGGFEYHKNKYSDKERGRVIWYAGGILDWANIYAMHRGVDEVDGGQYDEVADTDFATGCCMLLRSSTIEKIGFFDEKYFLYYEDIDYSQRTKEKGMRVIYYPKTFLWHKNASSSGKPGSNLHIYYQNRNRLYFGYKYASLRTKKSLFTDSLKLLMRGGIYTRSITDYYLGHMGGTNI